MNQYLVVAKELNMGKLEVMLTVVSWQQLLSSAGIFVTVEFQMNVPGVPPLSLAMMNTASVVPLMFRTGTSTWFTCQTPVGMLNCIA
jgi:hypothetical protein